MLFHLIVVWFHLKLCNEKRGGLLWPIARKRNLISLRSAAFFTIFVKHVIWSTPTNFTVIFFFIFLKNLTIPRLSINVRLFLVSRTLKRRKVIKWGFRYHKFSPRFCVYKWASSLFPGIVFKFHMVERWTVRIAKLTLTSPIEDINVQPEAHSLVLETKDCFVSLVTHLKSKNNVCNCKRCCLLYTQGNANPLTFKPI